MLAQMSASLVLWHIAFYCVDSSTSDISDESDSDFGASDDSKSVSPLQFKFIKHKASLKVSSVVV